MIAQVIVDVPTYHVDRPFDYKIPTKWQALIEPGCRVKVPFGARAVQGFVVALQNTTEVPTNKLKPIYSVLDIEPVLTPEMLALAKWLKEQTICFEIDALQVMLPSALRAKYEKYLTLQVALEKLDSRLQSYFAERSEINLKDIEKDENLVHFKAAVKKQQLQILTKVKQQGAVKKVRHVQIATLAKLQQVLPTISPRAHKQQQLLAWLLEHPEQLLLPKAIIQAAKTSQATLTTLVEKEAASYVNKEVYRDPFATAVARTTPLALTDEQQIALQALTNSLHSQQPETFVLHGITGSGKTEVYLQMIQEVLVRGQEAIMLVPEIALTPQMTERFRGRFGERVAVMHSGLSIGEKYDEWRKIQQGKVQVVVGARSAVFAPFTNIGVIILDEEHEATYKQEDTPRYHARDVAIWRSAYHNCPVILGSATPSLESYARAKKGVYTLLTLEKRALNQALPHVEVVDLREELRSGNRSVFSRQLIEAMEVCLKKQEQMVLFLNRRGYSSFVLCRDCGTVVQCKNCDISLTYHRSQEKIRCHYCGYEEPVPKICPQCQSEHIRFFGTGTQKIEEEIAALFPQARVLRMDVDTTRKKGAHEKYLQAFGDGEADILLGTQMIAKGLDFPNITLVGVLSADTSLHLPDYRAAEKTYQLLTQVSGRAGRHDKEGQVIVQTYTPEHYAIQLAKQQLYEPFFEREMYLRKRAGYPPYYFVALVQVTHEDVMAAAHFAQRAAQFLRAELSFKAQIIGPTIASVARIQNRYRYQCLIKYKIEPKLIATLHQLIAMYRGQWQKEGVVLTVDLDPSTI